MSIFLTSGSIISNSFSWNSVLVGTFGLCIGYSLREFLALIQKRRAVISNILSFQDDVNQDFKMVILVRTDLNMSKGKVAAQCCHACLAVYREAMKKCPDVVNSWEHSGQGKVTLKVESENEMMSLVQKAREMGLCAQAIRDQGRTQVISGTRTVAAIGPGKAKLIDYITGNLKLY